MGFYESEGNGSKAVYRFQTPLYSPLDFKLKGFTKVSDRSECRGECRWATSRFEATASLPTGRVSQHDGEDHKRDYDACRQDAHFADFERKGAGVDFGARALGATCALLALLTREIGRSRGCRYGLRRSVGSRHRI